MRSRPSTRRSSERLTAAMDRAEGFVGENPLLERLAKGVQFIFFVGSTPAALFQAAADWMPRPIRKLCATCLAPFIALPVIAATWCAWLLTCAVAPEARAGPGRSSQPARASRRGQLLAVAVGGPAQPGA